MRIIFPRFFFPSLSALSFHSKLQMSSARRVDLFSSTMVHWSWGKLFLGYQLLQSATCPIWAKVCWTQAAVAKLLPEEPLPKQVLRTYLSNRMETRKPERSSDKPVGIHWDAWRPQVQNLHRVPWLLGLDVWMLETQFSTPCSPAQAGQVGKADPLCPFFLLIRTL